MENVELKKYLADNAEFLHTLNELGVKTIQTALDCLTIDELNTTFGYIKNKTDRKDRIADQIGVSRRTVDSALSLLKKSVKIKADS